MIIKKELLKYSLKNLEHRKTRSLLTILSIFIGITAIFIFISFGIGLYDYVQSFTTSSSADKLTIMAKGFGPIDENFYLTQKDLEAVKKSPGVYDATGISFKAVELKQDKIKKYAFIIAYDPEKPIFFESVNVELFKGRTLQKGDDAKVILGYNYLIKDKIFPKAYDVNNKIIIQEQEIRITGFFEPIGNPQDDSQIYMTDNYFEKLYPNNTGKHNWIIAKVDSSRMKEVVAEVENSLRTSRNVEKGKEDFFVQSFEEMLNSYSNVLNGIVAFVILIGLVSVLVSAINTSSTMITSVLERVKEIGVMKSIGATNEEILKIFIIESGILGLIAGIIGVSLGWIISSTLGTIIKSAGWGFIAPAFPWQLFVSCIIFAVLTGTLSGLPPAIRASRINPVEALRYE